MKRLALDDLIQVVRFQLYDWMTGHGLMSMSAELLAEKIGPFVTASFVRVAMEQLSELGELKFEAAFGSIPMMNAPLPGKLTPRGIRMVETELRNPESKIARYVSAGVHAYESVSYVSDIPASDRIVSLDHNSAAYIDVSEKFLEAIDAIKSINISEEQLEERDNVVAQLSAGQILIKSTELTVMQIKVGVLMAAESAKLFASDTIQKLPVSLLVEAIKALLKLSLGMHI